MQQLPELFLSQALFHYLHTYPLLCLRGSAQPPPPLSPLCLLVPWLKILLLRAADPLHAKLRDGFLVVLEQTGFSEGGTGSCLNQL